MDLVRQRARYFLELRVSRVPGVGFGLRRASGLDNFIRGFSHFVRATADAASGRVKVSPHYKVQNNSCSKHETVSTTDQKQSLSTTPPKGSELGSYRARLIGNDVVPRNPFS